jgi:hypothetical protein
MTVRFGVLALVIFAVAATGREVYRTGTVVRTAAAGSQDVVSLNHRISLLEQRFYTVESRINNLEQEAIMARRAPSGQTPRDPEVDRLRGELELLKRRASELECGLVQLDERTLPASSREARAKAGEQPKDPCRLKNQSPVHLSTRP